MAYTFTNVFDKTRIHSQFSETDRNKILAAMEFAYNGSRIAKDMFDDWLKETPAPGQIIAIYQDPNTAAVRYGMPTVWIDFDLRYAERALYINNNGTAVGNKVIGNNSYGPVESMVVAVIVHELVHALTVRPPNEVGLSDGGIGTKNYLGTNSDPRIDFGPPNYRGETVEYANKIYAQLELLGVEVPQQNSYIAQDRINKDGTNNVLIPGFQYTDGAAIDRSVVITDAHYVYDPDVANKVTPNWDSSIGDNSILDTSPLTGKNDLLIGDERDNKLIAGRGNDFLYGGLDSVVNRFLPKLQYT